MWKCLEEAVMQTEAGCHLCQAWSHLVGATMCAETSRHSCGVRESVTQAEVRCSRGGSITTGRGWGQASGLGRAKSQGIPGMG